MTSQTQIPKTQELPEFIKGIATKKSEILQRRDVIKKEYLKLLDKLGKKNGKGKKIVHNDFLDVDVFFVMREGGSEAIMRSSYNWQSAYAVLNLETIVRKASAKEGIPIYAIIINNCCICSVFKYNRFYCGIYLVCQISSIIIFDFGVF